MNYSVDWDGPGERDHDMVPVPDIVEQLRWQKRYTRGVVTVTQENAAKEIERLRDDLQRSHKEMSSLAKRAAEFISDRDPFGDHFSAHDLAQLDPDGGYIAADRSMECPSCHNANKHGDYEGPTCEVCGGSGLVQAAARVLSDEARIEKVFIESDVRFAVNVLLEKIAEKLEGWDTWDIWRSDAAMVVRSFKHPAAS